MFLAFVRPLLGTPAVRCAWLRPMSIATAMCASLLCSGVAYASPAALDEIQQLMAKGDFNTAAKRVQTSLKQNSGDVQLRFLQAVIAAEQKKYDQAIRLFTALTKEHPTLPEPYNNLAVLYAFRGDDRKAAEVLEQAIRTNPSYATAHQNLGDLYARIASDAYAKALQLDNAQQAEKPKLELIARIATPLLYPATAIATSTAVPPVSESTPVTVATVPTPAPATLTPVTVATAPTSPPPAVTPVTVTTAPTSAPPVAIPVTPEPPPAPAQPVKTASHSDEQRGAGKPAAQQEQQQAVKAIEKAVAAWATAWEQQNMTSYYAAYSSRFSPQGMTLSAWKKERKDRIVGKPAITVKISNLKITVHGDRASASFRQQYSSGGYKASTRKTLQMELEGAKWRITKEEAGR